MPWRKPPKRQASRSNAARSVASACMRGSVGVGPTVGGKAQTRTLSAIRTAVVSSYTAPPKGSTTLCTDELGPILPRSFPPAPGWSADGHRIKAPLEYSRGLEKTWIYGALRVRDGRELTRCAASRNSKSYIALLSDI